MHTDVPMHPHTHRCTYRRVHAHTGRTHACVQPCAHAWESSNLLAELNAVGEVLQYLDYEYYNYNKFMIIIINAIGEVLQYPDYQLL